MKGYTFESKFIDRAGMRVHCRVSGPENGLPILFIHGLSGFSRDWDLLDLPQGLRLLAMDLPGFGDSNETLDHQYPLDFMLDSMTSVINEFSNGPALIVAHSRGARQVLGLPKKSPNLVKAFVLIDGAPSVPPEARQGTARNIAGTPHQFSSIEEAADVFRPKFPAYSDDELMTRLKHYLRKKVEGIYEIKRDSCYKEEFQKVLDGTAEKESGPNWWAMYEELTQPVYFVVAEKSKMVSEEILDRIISLKPEVKIFKINSAHNVPGENPGALSKIIQEAILELS